MNDSEIKLPEAFLSRMKELLGSDYDAFIESYSSEPQKGLRINTLKCKSDDFLGSSGLNVRKTDYIHNGYYLDMTESGVGNTAFHHAGMIYIQEPAAMIPVESAGIKKGDYVLDVCAAPGGKTSQIAEAAGEEGFVVSNEFVPSRAKILLSNVERLGIRNDVVTNTDAAHLKELYPEAFDCVLVDAPCSGEGMFRKNPLAISEWSENNVKMCAERSFGILADASCCLRNGGTLIYSTCTFAPEENELLIARFLEAFPEYTLKELPEVIIKNTAPGISVSGVDVDFSLCRRCYPHITGGEGQFVCVMQKGDESERLPIADCLKQLSKNEEKTVNAFLDDIFLSGRKPLVKKLNNVLYAVPKNMKVSGGCFSCGVKLGELKGDRIVPHHQLFSAYGLDMKRQWDFNPDDERLALYLHGDTVTLAEKSDDGFGCVTVCGCPLGGAKCVSGVLKNHYPKGLRRV